MRADKSDITKYVRFVIETDPKMRVWRVTEKELVTEQEARDRFQVFLTAFAYACNLGLDGYFVGLFIFTIAFHSVSGML